METWYSDILCRAVAKPKGGSMSSLRLTLGLFVMGAEVLQCRWITGRGFGGCKLPIRVQWQPVV